MSSKVPSNHSMLLWKGKREQWRTPQRALRRSWPCLLQNTWDGHSKQESPAWSFLTHSPVSRGFELWEGTLLSGLGKCLVGGTTEAKACDGGSDLQQDGAARGLLGDHENLLLNSSPAFLIWKQLPCAIHQEGPEEISLWSGKKWVLNL